MKLKPKHVPVLYTVREYFERNGMRTEGITVKTLSRGSDHLIVRGDDVIGEINHVSHRVLIYERDIPEQNLG